MLDTESEFIDFQGNPDFLMELPQQFNNFKNNFDNQNEQVLRVNSFSKTISH